MIHQKIVTLWLAALLITSCGEQKKQQPESSPKAVKNDLTVLNEEISKNPTADLYFRRAQIFSARNVYPQALLDLDSAAAMDSTRTDIYMLKADVSFRTLQIQNAVKSFEKVLQLDPKHLEANLKLCEIYLYTKGYQKCLHYADEALKIDKNKGKAYFLKGFAFKEMGDTVHALSSFQTVIEVEPDNYDAYIQLGNIQAAKRNKIALQYYNNALRLRPSSTEALYNRGLLFQNMGELENAKKDYGTILKIEPDYADAHYNLGYIAVAYEKDYKKAIEHFTDAIRTNSQYAEAYYNRGVAFERSGDRASAEKDYREALKIVPTFKLAKKKLGAGS